MLLTPAQRCVRCGDDWVPTLGSHGVCGACNRRRAQHLAACRERRRLRNAVPIDTVRVCRRCKSRFDSKHLNVRVCFTCRAAS